MTQRISRAGFDIDLDQARVREGLLAARLALTGRYVELKTDYRCADTGNLFLEVSQHGRPSGIAISSCEWWASEFDQDCYLIVPTVRMRRLARRAWQDGLRKFGGDNNNYQGVLLPIERAVLPEVLWSDARAA